MARKSYEQRMNELIAIKENGTIPLNLDRTVTFNGKTVKKKKYAKVKRMKLKGKVREKLDKYKTVKEDCGKKWTGFFMSDDTLQMIEAIQLHLNRKLNKDNLKVSKEILFNYFMRKTLEDLDSIDDIPLLKIIDLIKDNKKNMEKRRKEINEEIKKENENV